MNSTRGTLPGSKACRKNSRMLRPGVRFAYSGTKTSVFSTATSASPPWSSLMTKMRLPLVPHQWLDHWPTHRSLRTQQFLQCSSASAHKGCERSKIPQKTASDLSRIIDFVSFFKFFLMGRTCPHDTPTGTAFTFCPNALILRVFSSFF